MSNWIDTLNARRAGHVDGFVGANSPEPAPDRGQADVGPTAEPSTGNDVTPPAKKRPAKKSTAKKAPAKKAAARKRS